LAPCPSSNDVAGWSDGPVVSLRVQAVDVRAANARDARRIHLVVGRDMGTSQIGWQAGGPPNLKRLFCSF